MTLFVTGFSASGEGGELDAVGNALMLASEFIVTMNCSFNASYCQSPSHAILRITINRHRHILKFSS